MSHAVHRILRLTTGICLLLAAAGCANGPVAQQHQAAVKAATEKWNKLRSGYMLQTAQRQFEAGDLDLAEKTVTDTLAKDPTHAGLYVLGGRIVLERGQLERSLLLLQRATELDPRQGAGHYYLGVVQQRLQDHAKACASYQRAFEIVSDNPAYLLAWAEMLVALDRPEEALGLLEKHAKVFDQNAGIRLAIAQLHLMARRYDQAAEYFQRASLLRPEDLGVAEELASAQLAAGQVRQAVSTYERLCGLVGVKERPDLHLALGGAYAAAGRLQDAKAVYLKVMRQNGRDPEVWVRLGETTWALGDLAGALTAAEQISKLDARRHEGPLLAGMVHQARGKAEAALKCFDQAAELAPDQAAPLILRGLALQQSGRNDLAAQAYREALRRQPDDARAQRLLAHVTGQGQ